MIKRISILFMAMAWLFLANSLFAKEPAGHQNLSFNKPGLDKEVQTQSNIGNFEYWVRHDGWSGRNPTTGNSGGIYPKGTAGVIFQDGLIWGGIVNDNRAGTETWTDTIRVGGQTYSIGTSPGWIVTPGTATTLPTAVDANSDDVRIYRIRRDYESLSIGDPSVVADAALLNGVSVGDVTDEMQQQVLDDYANDWNQWPVSHGAPVEANGNPGIAGADQVIWYATNDLDQGATTLLYGSHPIGLEIQTTLWAYNQPGATLGQLIFKRYRIINKSGLTIDSMFVAQWSDPDVGNFTDDLVGNDRVRSLGFAYSGGLTDADFDDFGLPPASAGYDFFQGPIVASPGDTAIFNLSLRPGFRNLPMTSFGYFAAGSSIGDPELGDYDGTLEWYNLLNGFTPTNNISNPTPFVSGFGPNRGNPTFFPVDGDPVKQVGDIDGFGDNLPPGDRRLALASGPFTMVPGDTQEVVVAVVGGIVTQQGGNNRNAVAQLKLNDDFAQFIFDKLFQGIPSPPPSPNVRAIPQEDKIMLDFGFNAASVAATEADDPLLGFNFEGYNIYQLPNAKATKSQGVKIATFDKDNTITQISAAQFVPEFGDIVTVPVQAGTNTGIQRFYLVENDAIRGKPLFAGNSYFFAVTAYNAKDEDGDGIVDSDVPEPALESALNIIAVTPQSNKPGERTGVIGSDIEITHSAGVSDGVVKALVIDATKTTGHNYEVFFKVDTDSNSATFGETLWNVRDMTTGGTVFETDQPQVADVEATRTQPFFDGIQVRVAGPAPGVKDWDIPQGTRRFTWSNADGFEWEGFNGAIGWGSPGGPNGFGTLGTSEETVPASQLKNTLLILAQVDQGEVLFDPVFNTDDPNMSFAYRYGRGFANPPAQPEFAPHIVNPSGGYSFQEFAKTVPLTAWDVEDPDNPRQLELGYLENNGEDGLVDGKYWPSDASLDNTAGSGPREWLWVYDADYSETPNPAWQNDALATPLPVMWWLTVNRRGPVPFSPGGSGEDQFLILAGHINTDADVFSFTAPAVTNSTTDAQEDVEKINVFPNPYYAFNPEETTRFDRFVTFSHLPKKATIRLFTISGIQVRKLEKDSDSQFLRWDLRNESTLPVASGIYIAHIDMPDLGKTKVIKVFIIQGEEILEFF